MVGAILVLLLVIGVFVGFRALNREELEVRPEPVDHLAAVEALQQEGVRVAYPRTLPEGWQVTSVESRPAEEPLWGLGMLTDDDRFAGVRQESASTADLVEEYVDEDATPGDPLTLGGDLGGRWSTFTDAGGDTALATEHGDATVLVYGSAPASELRALAESLTTAPVH
jgi:hypothetical protein